MPRLTATVCGATDHCGERGTSTPHTAPDGSPRTRSFHDAAPTSPVTEFDTGHVTSTGDRRHDVTIRASHRTLGLGRSCRTATGLGAGMVLAGATNAEICTLANRPGDRFVVSLAQTVSGPDGATLPAGTPVLVELGQPGPNGEFAFRLKGVQLNGEFIAAEGGVQVADATVTERSISKGGDKGKVITGAIAGAILGRVLGAAPKAR